MLGLKSKSLSCVLRRLSVVALLSLVPALEAAGEDAAGIPECDFSSITLTVPADMRGHTEDPKNLKGNKFEYGVTGCVFDPLSEGEIPLREDANNLDDNTVFKVLAKMRRAYDRQNVGAIKRLYTSDSVKRLSKKLSKKRARSRFLKVIGSIDEMYAGVAFEWKIDSKNVIVVMMIQKLKLGKRKVRTVSPVIFRDVSNDKTPAKFRAVAGGSDEPIFANLAVFLKGRDPSALLPE